MISKNVIFSGLFILSIFLSSCDSSSGAPTYDIDTNGIPKLITAQVTDLAKITQVSRFRSAEGHDYTDSTETCRSMKNYINPFTQYRTNTDVPVYAPAAGTVTAVSGEELENVGVTIRIDANQAFYLNLGHVTRESTIRTGATVQAGDLIGYGYFIYPGTPTPAVSFDYAAYINTPTGVRYISPFDMMTDVLFASYQQRGATSVSQFVISKAERDADPIVCAGSQFESIGNIDNCVQLGDDTGAGFELIPSCF